MIIEALINIFLTPFFLILDNLVQTSNAFFVNFEIFGLIADFAELGCYVLGTDLVLAIMGSFTAWLTIKVSIGVILFLWRLLPLT